MTIAETTANAREKLQGLDSERTYLRQGFLSVLALALLCVGWMWGVALIVMGMPSFSSPYWASPFLLIALSSLSLLWRERHLRLATALALAAAWLAPTATAFTSGNNLFLFGHAVVLIVAGVLTTPLITTLLAAASIAYILVAGPLLGHASAAVPVSLNLSIVLFVLLMLGLSWLLCKYIYLALDWSWNSQQRATREMLIARERRAELRRAVKALNEQYERLARLNLELFEARREAEEARRLKAEFAANVSHELRTPINLIVGFSEMMVTAPESYGGQALPPEYMGDVYAIYRSARHLQSLIEDILDLARIDARYMGLTRELTDVGGVVTEATEAIQDLVQTKGLQFHVDVPPQLPPAYLDRTRIRQVLLNLVSNAIRFTDNGFIRVSCALHDAADLGHPQHPTPPQEAQQSELSATRYICIKVTDSGVGIKPEHIDSVFEEFRQVDGSTKRKHGGTGLGLAISKRFVELHGGWMWVESQVGKGSTFAFVLPVADEPHVKPDLISSQRDSFRQPVEKTMVVMDQEPAVIQVFRRYIQTRRVEGATDPAQAMRLVNELHPDLLVWGNPTDDHDLRAVQADYPELAKARLTVLSCAVPSDHAKALALGLIDYLVKPITQERLAETLRRMPAHAEQILVIEDDPNMMRLLERMLSRIDSKIRLKKAYSAEEGLALLRIQTPELVLLDLGLPGMSGYDLLKIMQSDDAWNSIPVAVITANTQWEADVSRTPTIKLTREAGFTVRELLALTELVADKFPCQYAPAESLHNPKEADK
ncbi:MAG: response regulator [Chloroflexi bacterium]|nr:response regulator [Chloroflexota bacterium]